MLVEDMVPAGVAAVELGCSREMVVRMIQRGALDGVLVAGRYLIPRPALAAFLQKRPDAKGIRERTGAREITTSPAR